ncbi:MAG TPA: 50S ribosomal protein L22 [Candidatus Paceibacterota bacterium]|nr:50S ribosomal protein L22 [Candidatus Paceibacterota bacterium]
MADATATLSNYRQAPRKVRLVADLIRGKDAAHALALLSTLPKRASEPMAKLLRSALANSKTTQPENLIVSKIEVNGGIVFKRQMPRARGRASLIRKKTSHITLALKERAPAKK